MLVSEEQVAALEAEVAGLLGILEVLDEDGASEGIHRYVEQVERLSLIHIFAIQTIIHSEKCERTFQFIRLAT